MRKSFALAGVFTYLLTGFAAVFSDEHHSFDGLGKKEALNMTIPSGDLVPAPQRCVIDLSKKSTLAVRVRGSRKTYHYPVLTPRGRNIQQMAIDLALARELLNAPIYLAYATNRYGITYGYDGEGLLVFTGLLIEDCLVPIPLTGLFVPIQPNDHYINRQFLAQYFNLITGK